MFSALPSMSLFGLGLRRLWPAEESRPATPAPHPGVTPSRGTASGDRPDEAGSRPATAGATGRH